MIEQLRRLSLTLLWLLAFSLGAHAAGPELTTLPTGTGLPVVARVGVFFVDVTAIDDVAKAFTATVDVRAVWTDLRLRYPPTEASNGFKEYRGAGAITRLSEIWSPDLSLVNLQAAPDYDSLGLRVFPEGRVELMRRVKASFAASFDASRFPFDRQLLAIELASQRDPTTQVLFDFRQNDVEFSRLSRNVRIDGWALGAVELRRDPALGWYGSLHSRIRASLHVAREPSTTFAQIFIPLIASLLIPMLALWLNAIAPGGEFRTEAFELTNVLIGGLFALIALNFTVNAAYPILANDNPVSRLFGLNYLLLGLSLGINILIFRFHLPARWFGAYVQEELYHWLVWAVPAIALIGASTILLTAMV